MSDPVSGGIQAAGGLISGIGNLVLGAKQLKLQREQFDYQKQLNETMMQREDTAVQRRADDMAEAGINKNLAAGAPASAGAMSVGQPIGAEGASTMAQGFEQLGQIPAQSIGLGLQMSKSIEELKSMRAQQYNLDTQSSLNVAKQITEAERTGLVKEQAAETAMSKLLMEAQRNQTNYNTLYSANAGIRTNDSLKDPINDSVRALNRTDGHDNANSLFKDFLNRMYGSAADAIGNFLGGSADARARQYDETTTIDSAPGRTTVNKQRRHK